MRDAIVSDARHNRLFATSTARRFHLESELSGYLKGSFYGTLTHKGKVEMVDGGTLFLDEIGEIRSRLQLRILRLIQEKEIDSRHNLFAH